MKLTLGRTRAPPVRDLEVEVVERKGRGHPDSLCDALAEELSRALSQYYLEHFGTILHHNVDKALLFGGAARPAFGGGEVLAPMRIYLVGRATREFDGKAVPVEDIARNATRAWVRTRLRHLDPSRHLELCPLIRPGSADLVQLFVRQAKSGVPLANDTSVGVGFAPLTDLESIVTVVEATLDAQGARGEIPELGEDIKVMGVRRGDRITLTVAAALLGQLLPDMRAYLRAKERIRASAVEAARSVVGAVVEVDVNTADDPERNSVYITVTGTSAEAGDDGEAGRGNRANGLNTPYRPMTLESSAGKNPVNHVGKLYQVGAQRIADALIGEIGPVVGAECVLVSRIGHPIDDPQIADVRLDLEDGSRAGTHAGQVEAIVLRELDALRFAWRELITVPGELEPLGRSVSETVSPPPVMGAGA